jgi:hypothetical protein
MDSFAVTRISRWDMSDDERAARDAKHRADDRRRTWAMYKAGEWGPRNAVYWDPDPRAFPGEVWIDLAGIACECVGEYGDPTICAAWIAGGEDGPPRWAYEQILSGVARIAVARAEDHPAAILDARALVRAIMDRPPEGGITDYSGPGELLRRLRNVHDALPRDTRPNLLVCLPAPDTWPRDLEARSGLASGRMVWASGR